MSSISASTTSTTGFKVTADTTGTLVLQTGATPTTAVTIDGSQNVGVGVTSPAYRLQFSNGTSATILGVDNAGDNSGAGVALLGGSTVKNWFIGNQYNVNGGLEFTPSTATGGSTFTTPAMVLDSSSNLLVGTTSQVNNALTTLTSSTARASLSLACTTANQGNNVLYIQKFDNTTTTGTVFVAFAINNGGAGSGQINANGSGAAAFGSYSDSRLKENIVDLPSQLSNIMALRPVEFDYIESEGGGHQIGFIAQEMQTIYPDAVGERVPDNMLSITGWSKTEARLVKAIQEQQALINQLQADVAALKGAA